MPSTLIDSTLPETPLSKTPLGGWRVMIVEDNPAVAALHKRIADSTPSLRAVHVARNAEHALVALETVQPDLLILDLTMAGGDGLPLLRQVRRAGMPIDVIVVTASREGEIVNEVVKLGVVDYLVKPFSPQRLRQSLAAFTARRRTLSCREELSQADVDTVQASGSPAQRRRLPRGLEETTLRSVLSLVEQSPDSYDAEQVGSGIGVARVTARRYLEYLVQVGVMEMSRERSGPGRPRNRYRMRPRKKRAGEG